MDAYQHIEPAILWKAAGDDPQVFRALSQLFLETAPPMRARLERAILAGDTSATLHDSHALKGSTLLVGAAPLNAMLADIEGRAWRGQHVLAAPCLPELARRFDAVMREVKASIDDFPGDAGGGNMPEPA